MNILLLNYEYPPLGGGAGLISRYIAEGLAGRGQAVTVVTTWFPGEQEEQTTKEGTLKIIRLKSRRRHAYKSNVFEMYSWMRHAKAFLRTYLSENNFDVAMANFSLPGGAIGKYALGKFGLPYVILSHGHDIPWFYPRQMWFYHLVTWGWIRTVCRKAEAIFVQSEQMFKNTARFVGINNAGKINLIHNGADYHVFFPDGSVRCDRFRILFAGRLVRQKGPVVFLEAMKKLQVMNVPFEAVIIGDGPMRRAMQDYVKKHQLMYVVRFIGWVDKQEMPMAYRTAHCLVAPSVNEGMSIAMNEALASGLYVLTTDVSNNASLIRHGVNGEIIPVKDPLRIAERLKAFFYEKFSHDYQVPEEDVRRFHEEYDWDHMVRQYERSLEEIVSKKEPLSLL